MASNSEERAVKLGRRKKVNGQWAALVNITPCFNWWRFEDGTRFRTRRDSGRTRDIEAKVKWIAKATPQQVVKRSHDELCRMNGVDAETLEKTA